jgi:aspartate beta-hydroxylase
MDAREIGLREAMSARQAGNDAAASARLDRLLKDFPDEARAHNMLGMIALSRQSGKDAAHHFSNAIRHDPGVTALHINLATAARMQGDDDAERAALEGALGCDQRDFMAWLRKAELHQRRAELGAALQAWNTCLRLSAMLDPIPDHLAHTLMRGGQWVAEHNMRYAAAIDDVLSRDVSDLPNSERRRVTACIDAALGRRTIYRNQCEGVEFPFLPADEFFDEAHFPWFAALEAQTDAIRGELIALIAADIPGFEPYVQQQPGMPQNIWSTLDGTLDWSAYFLWNYGARIDAACKRCPQTAAALDQVPRVTLPGKAPSAFFSVLKPKTQIPAHTGVTNVRAIVHLPLIVPSGCRFRVGGESRAWAEGKAFAFDDTIEHEAWNDSDDMRAVLIFDVWNPHISETERDILQKFFNAIDASEYRINDSSFR